MYKKVLGQNSEGERGGYIKFSKYDACADKSSFIDTLYTIISLVSIFARKRVY